MKTLFFFFLGSSKTPSSWAKETRGRRSSSGHKRSASWGSAEHLREASPSRSDRVGGQLLEVTPAQPTLCSALRWPNSGTSCRSAPVMPRPRQDASSPNPPFQCATPRASLR